MSTLILNADGQPLSVIPLSTLGWQEAIKLMFLDRINILEYYEDWIVRSPSVQMTVPSVAMVKEYISTDHYVKFSRHNVFLRDEYNCQYCGDSFLHNTKQLSFDHVIPRSKGGRTNWVNIVTSCMDCNVKKSDKMKMSPLRKAKRPNFYDLAQKRKKFPIKMPKDSNWNTYLMWDDELVQWTNAH